MARMDYHDIITLMFDHISKHFMLPFRTICSIGCSYADVIESHNLMLFALQELDS